MSSKELNSLVQQVEAFCESENWDEALSIAENIVKRWPKEVLSFYARGRARWGKGDFEHALEDLNHSISLDSKYPKAYNYLGNVYDGLKQYEEAIACYDRAIVLKPDYTVAYYNKAVTLYKLKRYEEALRCYDHAIKLKPDFAYAYTGKGNVFYYLKRYEEALQSYSQAIEIDPDNAIYHYNRGLLYETTDREELALRDYEECLKNNSTHFLTRLGMKRITAKNQAPSQKSTKLEKAIRRFKEGKEKPDVWPSDEYSVKLNPLISRIRQFHENSISKKIEEKSEEKKKGFKQFTVDQVSPGISIPQFYVLRRWNSYTPIIANNGISCRGGGYFLHLGESGIVFDPGFDFIENFMEAEFTFSQISKVFISHAHNDHDADLESILTLLHVYNSEVKDNVVKILIEEASDEKIPGLMKKTENEIYDFLNSEFSIRYNNRRKVIDIYLSLSAFKNTLPYWISSRPVTTAFMC